MLKKILFLAVAVGSLSFLCTPSLAAPSGGTDIFAEGRPWAVAAEYDYLYKRDMESSDIKDGEAKEANTAYGKVTFRPSKFLSLYGKFGIVNFETEMDMNTGKTIEEKYNAGIYTGGGARLNLELGPSFRISVDNQYGWQSCDIDDVTYGGIAATTKTGDITVWEYQLSGILSYKLTWEKVVHPIHGEYPALIPYAGAKYAYLEMDSDVTASGPGYSISAPDKRKNDRRLGVICGLDIDFISLGGFVLNIEGRFLDETAISGYVSYNF